MLNKYKNLGDRELIEAVKVAYGAKDIKDLGSDNIPEVQISYSTLAKWHQADKIATSGTGRQYLELLLICKDKDKEILKRDEKLETIKKFKKMLLELEG